MVELLILLLLDPGQHLAETLVLDDGREIGQRPLRARLVVFSALLTGISVLGLNKHRTMCNLSAFSRAETRKMGCEGVKRIATRPGEGNKCWTLFSNW
jgi:hypothetical protein